MLAWATVKVCVRNATSQRMAVKAYLHLTLRARELGQQGQRVKVIFDYIGSTRPAWVR